MVSQPTINSVIGIPLNQLIISPENVRVVTPNRKDDKKLIASILSVGVLQNLVVIKAEGNLHEVIAGGRRLAALQYLAETDQIEQEYLVPCRVAEDARLVTEMSLAENTQRSAMHPADQFVAFAKLQAQQYSIRDIATKFGVSQKIVKQRLALGELAPFLVDLYRQDKLDELQMQAFTVCPDYDRQVSCYHQLAPHSLSVRNIKSTLLNEAITSDSGIGKFVGKSAYVKAKGTVISDLFGENVYFADTELVEQLALAKLADIAESLKKEGWKWVNVSLSRPDLPCVNVQPNGLDVPQELNDKKTDLEALVEKCREECEENDWQDDFEAKYDEACDELSALEEEIDALEEGYTDDQKAYCGCYLYLDFYGDPTTQEGMAHKEDLPVIEESEVDAVAESTSNDGDVKAYSQALCSDLGAYRQQATKAVLLQSPELAQALLNFSLCSQILGHLTRHYHYSSLLSAQFRVVDSQTSLDDLDNTKADMELKEAFDALPTDWLIAPDSGARFNAFRALSPEAQSKLVAFCVAQILSVGVRGSADADNVVDLLSVPFAEYWRPSQENFFGRLNKAQLQATFTPVRHEGWGDWTDDLPKKNIVASMQEWILQSPEGDDDPRLTWLPAQF